MKKIFILLKLFIFILCFTGCGQKGPLYYPSPKSPEKQQSS